LLKKNKDQPSFVILPAWRMYKDFPWQIWAVGWLAIFKAVIWLSISPNCPDPVLNILAIKHLICMAPFIIFGIGVWNLKKWAVWGIIVLCIVDLVFVIIFQRPSGCAEGGSIQHFHRFSQYLLYSIMIFLNGPVGSVFILIAAPYLLKHSGKNYRDVLSGAK